MSNWTLLQNPHDLDAYRQQFITAYGEHYRIKAIHGWTDPQSFPALVATFLTPDTGKVSDVYVYPQEAITLVQAATGRATAISPGQGNFNQDLAAQHMALVALLTDKNVFSQEEYLRKVPVMRSVVDQLKAENRDTIMKAIGPAVLATAEIVPKE